MPTHLSARADLERVLLTAEDFVAREWLDTERVPSMPDSGVRTDAQER